MSSSQHSPCHFCLVSNKVTLSRSRICYLTYLVRQASLSQILLPRQTWPWEVSCTSRSARRWLTIIFYTWTFPPPLELLFVTSNLYSKLAPFSWFLASSMTRLFPLLHCWLVPQLSYSFPPWPWPALYRLPFEDQTPHKGWIMWHHHSSKAWTNSLRVLSYSSQSLEVVC